MRVLRFDSTDRLKDMQTDINLRIKYRFSKNYAFLRFFIQVDK